MPFGPACHSWHNSRAEVPFDTTRCGGHGRDRAKRKLIKGTLNYYELAWGSYQCTQIRRSFMPLPLSYTADKFIVDRRKAHRNSDVSRAVRKTRDRLSQQAGNPSFDRELLKLHAQAMINSASAIPLLVLLITSAGLLAGMSVDIVVWAIVTVTCYAGLALVALRVDKSDAADIDATPVQRYFLAAHLLSGAGWAYFALLACG